MNFKQFLLFAAIVTTGATFAQSFPVNGPWSFKNYNLKLALATNELSRTGEFTILGASNACDTAWHARSGKTPVPAGASCLLVSFEVKSDKFIQDAGLKVGEWSYGIFWYDAAGRQLSTQTMPHVVVASSRSYQRVREWCAVPPNAAYVAIQTGFDSPNIDPGESLSYRGFRIEAISAERSARLTDEWEAGDYLRSIIYPEPAKPVIDVKLREDGMAIVDGQPFFPIGIYSVCKREFNSNNFDRAFADLKSAGFNFAHTYGNSYDDEFLAAARKYDFRLWVRARIPDENFLSKGRWNPSILAWYLGDDTSSHIKPQELFDYHNLVKAADPSRRLTCQADPIYAHWSVSRYAGYVRQTDVFMPEIYPIKGDAGDPSDTNCVAQTIIDMQCVASDVRKFGDGSPRACWPILQYFQGWSSWRHFPSRDQLWATSWAAIIHGANGITWYTYGGFFSQKTGKYNEGITSTPERWENIKTLATQIKEFAPVLLTRTPLAQPQVAILEGPALDPMGKNPAVTCLLKQHNGQNYLFAVNACPEPVKARITLPDGSARIESFKPFGTLVGKQ